MSEGIREGENCGSTDTLLRPRLRDESSEPRLNRGSEGTTRRNGNRRVNGRTLYKFKTSSGRTSNVAEVAVVSRLEAAGYTVYKNGWPDLLAVKDDEVRFIEVKPHSSSRLSLRQWNVAKELKKFFGVEVEIATP